MKLFFTLLFSLSFFFAQSQDFKAGIQTSALLGNSENLPFWMTHNQLGKYSSRGNFQELTEGQLSGSLQWPGKLTLSYGTDMALLISEHGADPKIIQAYLGLSGKVIRMQAGAFADEELFSGLSSSNGDLLRSLNYRPIPKVRLSTPGFIPFLWAKNWFSFKAEYDEAILNDERVVSKPHLHHKSLMFRLHNASNTRFTFGLNHFVFWGGNSELYGPFPDRPKDYIRYVTGAAGGAGYLDTDRQNAAGSQLGSYLFSLEQDFEKFHVEVRVSHPYEDGSGMGFENKDNLYTFHWRKNATGSLLDELVIEYLYTKHQSGDRKAEEEAGVRPDHIRGGDDYFNNGVYQTGFTYKEQIMGTPLFGPLRYNTNGVVTGVANNRVEALHAGAKGTISQSFTWNAKVTLSRNFGTYYAPFSPARRQLYSLAQLSYLCKKLPIQLNALLGLDAGELLPDNVGLGGQIIWKIQ